MKINSNPGCRLPNAKCGVRHPPFVIRHSKRGLGAPKRSEDGMATFVCIALMIIMAALVMAESSALFHLHREMKMLEQKQIQRLGTSQTNAVSVAKVEVK